MKRSRSLVLTSMMAGGSLSLQACDSPAPAVTQWGDGPPAASAPASAGQTEGQQFTSVADCEASGQSAADCQTAFAAAQADNEANAPRFADRQSCEERYGVEQCVPRNQAGGGSFFTPLLTGFILGQALNNFGGGRGGRAYYRDRFGNDSLAGGGRIGRSRGGGDAFGPPATRQAPARVQSRSGVVSRGGFGGGGRGYG